MDNSFSAGCPPRLSCFEEEYTPSYLPWCLLTLLMAFFVHLSDFDEILMFIIQLSISPCGSHWGYLSPLRNLDHIHVIHQTVQYETRQFGCKHANTDVCHNPTYIQNWCTRKETVSQKNEYSSR